MEMYVCSHCGNMITYVENKGVPVMCCGQKMEKIVPNSVDAAGEKHVPVVKTEGNLVTVTVGSVEHPMLEEHHIAWVILKTAQGVQRKFLKPGQKPEVTFALTEGDSVECAYEYCNLHGLWKSNYSQTT